MKVYEYLIIIWFWPLSVLGAIATQELFTESRELSIKPEDLYIICIYIYIQIE